MSVGYDPTNETLEIEFRSGAVYQYDSVPNDVYTGLMSAGTKGGYHAVHIKDRFPYQRVG